VTGVETRLAIAGTDSVHDELSSLRQWLGQESEFRGRVRIEQAATQSGQMGGLAEALSVALSSEGALTVLAASVAVWLRQRRSKLTVKITNVDGSFQEITASGPVADTIGAKVDPRQRG
jgi:Effector Associated Constant Component 1